MTTHTGSPLKPTSVIVWGRRGWRKLISMRTALVLLFLLAIASVPGSLLPQRPLNPANVTRYLQTHGAWGTLLDRLGFFDVFGSVWFAAIYLLLFVSLVGCLFPRIKVHTRSLLARPLPAPRHLSRLPESATFETALPPAQAAAVLRRALGRRWRTQLRDEPSGALAVSAEKGYSRETGNIIFHLALLAALVLVAFGRLYHYEGSILVTEGDGFCNSPAVFDSWRPGRVAASGGISPAPFCVKVNKFTASYLPTGEPTSYAANISYYDVKPDGTNGTTRADTLRVNHPLRLGGDRLYLISHGFTPVITVTLPDGTTRTTQNGFIPSDNTTLLSQGAFSLPTKNVNDGIGIQGIFAPTPVETSPGVYTSISPQLHNPVLGIFVWRGDLGIQDGKPQSVYTVDTSRMTKIGGANLRAGQTSTFPGGVTVRFDGYKQWVALQVSHDPTQGWLLLTAATMVAGLIGSLAVRRRRLWVRASAVAGGPTLISVGGLARSDSGNFAEEFAAVVGKLKAAAPPPSQHSDELTFSGRR